MRGYLVIVLSVALVAIESEADRDKSFGDVAFQDDLVRLMVDAERLHLEGSLPSNTVKSVLYRNDETACYEYLGCFKKYPIGILPEGPDEILPIFQLFTQESSNNAAMLYSYDSEFGLEDATTRAALRNISRQLVFVAHGFGGSADLDWMHRLRAIKTKTPNPANVVLIDWRHGARYTTLYTGAAANTAMVAHMAAHLCFRLMNEFGIPMRNVEFIGFSLGGQMAGFFAERMFDLTDHPVGRITALDSASPIFELYDIFPRKEYAEFLEAVHTAAGDAIWKGHVGVTRNYGHVDFYPNGGVDQPGCVFPHLACSHNRAVEYYVEALESNSLCFFSGFPCETVEQAQHRECSLEGDPSHYITMPPKMNDSSIYFLKTHSASPYCIR